MKKHQILIAVTFIALLTAPQNLYAGGGCSGGGRGGGGSRGAANGESLAIKKLRLSKSYDMGEGIVDGNTSLRPQVSGLVEAQKKALQEFKHRMPNPERIDQIAGRLSNQQLDAIKHYLSTKYPAGALSAEHARRASWKEQKAALED